MCKYFTYCINGVIINRDHYLTILSNRLKANSTIDQKT